MKRFKATPLRAIEFISAQVFSRFFIVAFMAVVVYLGTDIFLHFKMYGSYLVLALLTVFAARLKSEELAGGLINFLTFPMMIMSGIFFSLEGTPQLLQNVSMIFLQTHFIDASRKVMLDGVGLMAVMDSFLVLVVSTVLFLLLAALIFKWE